MPAAELVPAVAYGQPRPRVAPPLPLRHDAKAFGDFSESIGWTLRPWQDTCARYLTATAADDRWMYREVAIIVARQNGKTTILVPLIVSRLLAGHRIMHTAQNRELPREVFGLVADIVEDKYADLLTERNGRPVRPRFANGQEEIKLTTGGTYRIVAPTRGGARGPSNDLVIVDELREMVDHDFIAAAKPTLTASKKPQMVYLSNAGTEDSAVLNALKLRAGEDPSLAYLEWSAAPDRRADDVEGWREANPSMGHDPSVFVTLEAEYRTNKLGGTLGIFETEHLCRPVVTLRERLVDEFAWAECEVAEPPAKRQAYMAVAMDPSGTRGHAAVAWRMPDESIALRVIREATGSPIDPDEFGKDLRNDAKEWGAIAVGYDPLTDRELAKYFRAPKSVTGQEFANASARFTLAVTSRKLRWHDAAAVTDDLTWTTKKAHDESGSFQAVRANDDRPITAALAAIRAVWLASNPPRSSGARIY